MIFYFILFFFLSEAIPFGGNKII